MKIVGRTDNGYLCQISEEEIGIITGFGRYPTYGDRKEDFYRATGRPKPTGSYGSYGEIPTDTTINVSEMHSYIRDLREKENKAKQLARTLTELAEMITSGLPTIAIAPTKPEEIDGGA